MTKRKKTNTYVCFVKAKHKQLLHTDDEMVEKCNRYTYILDATSTQTEHHQPSGNKTSKNQKPWFLRQL